MKHRFLVTISLMFLLLQVVQAQGLPAGQFVRIQSDGEHTMLSDSLNVYGNGETVRIPHEYYMGKYAVTNSEWMAFIKATDRKAPRYWGKDGNMPSGRERHPVVWVSYDDAEAYCKWLETQYPDYTFRLPTQAEWEYAAVGNNRFRYPWGNRAETVYEDGKLSSKFNYNAVFGAVVLQQPDRIATYNHKRSVRYGEKEPVSQIFSIREGGQLTGWINHRDYTGFVYTDVFREVNEAGGYTCPVDSFPQGVSPFGCYNMSGNCWEWTSTVETATNGAERGKIVNVIKGGSWYATSRSCSASYRGEGRSPRGAYATVGLRVVATRK